jgi:hypothetical protein
MRRMYEVRGLPGFRASIRDIAFGFAHTVTIFSRCIRVAPETGLPTIRSESDKSRLSLDLTVDDRSIHKASDAATGDPRCLSVSCVV